MNRMHTPVMSMNPIPIMQVPLPPLLDRCCQLEKAVEAEMRLQMMEEMVQRVITWFVIPVVDSLVAGFVDAVLVHLDDDLVADGGL